ncbi:YdgA family protein [Legionella sp.]|uniref:YdgA family protein n=1 Tax=Legionella sp. TaxID=459 RepID=UPI003C9082AF
MKKLAGLVIILAALVLGGYYGMGVLTERTIRKNMEVMDQSNGLHAKIKNYNRGLFSSTAEIEWQLHIPQRVVTETNGTVQTISAQDYTLGTPLIIHHGPVIFINDHMRFGMGYAESVFPFPHQYDAQFDSTFTKESIKPQLDLSVFVNYSNYSTINSHVPAFHLYGKESNSRFDWSGMNMTTTMSPGMKKISGTVDLDDIHIAKDDSTADISKASTDYDLHETLSGLYLGDANFKLPSFNIAVKGQKIFEIIDLIVKSDSDIEQHLFNSNFALTMKSIFANAQNYGPGELVMSLRNLDADVLVKINQQAAAMQNGTDVQRQQALIALLPELARLFSKGAEFEISKLSFTIPQGEVEGSLFVSLPKGENINPFELMQKINGKAKLKVPAAAVKELMRQSVIQQIAKQPDLQQTLAQQLQGNQIVSTSENQPTLTVDQIASIQTEKQLSALQQTGLITVLGTNYLIEVTLEQGKFIVNGKPFDSAMLKF